MQRGVPGRQIAAREIRARIWSNEALDEDSANDDRRMAAALDPTNARWQIDLGYALATAQHYWAAKRAFDRALAIAESWGALAGRAAVNYSLHDVRAAYADARRSVLLQDNAPAYIVLGDLASDRKDPGYAGAYWLEAYRLGERSVDLLVRLQGAGIGDPDKEVERRELGGGPPVKI